MLKPSWTWRDGFVHLNHELPHRVHVAKVYPIHSPNGSSIIIYGHEHGLTIIWKGGKPYQNKQRTDGSSKNVDRAKNGFDNDAIMIIDSDEEETGTLPAKTNNSDEIDDFESEEEEFDPSEPYDQILKVLDVPDLRIGVLHLAVPNIISKTNKSALEPLPSILDGNIVVAAACVDSSIRLFTVPLTPKRQQNHSARESQAQQYIISEGSAPPAHSLRGISMTWTGQQSAISPGREDQLEWSLLLASHTGHARGVLSVFQQMLSDDGSQLSEASPILLHRETLRHPATTISFSSSQYPSRRHTQLLLVDFESVLRIYDPLPRRRLHSARSNDKQQTPKHQGVWLASIYPPFEDNSRGSAGLAGYPERHKILDAQWAFDGMCVITLLGDGQWGLWDIEGVGPRATKVVQDGGNENAGSSIGSISKFALRSFIGDGAASTALKIASDGTTDLLSRTAKEPVKLAPMTPNTRKVKQQKLFSDPTAPLTSISPYVRGGLSLCTNPDSSTRDTPDESLVLWYGNAVYAVPSLMAYWQRVASSSSKIPDSGTLIGPSIAQLTALSTMGEMITGISQTPAGSERSISSTTRTKSTRLQHDVLMAAEHRLVMLCRAKPRDQELRSAEYGSPASKPNAIDDVNMKRLDQNLLSKRQLDLGGVERVLDGMASGNHDEANGGLFGFAAGRSRRVGFAAGF